MRSDKRIVVPVAVVAIVVVAAPLAAFSVLGQSPSATQTPVATSPGQPTQAPTLVPLPPCRAT
jgi:hypothetical protein